MAKKKQGQNAQQDDRGRNWATIVYAENHDQAEIMERLNEMHLKWFLSPIHDLDTWKESDIEKKLKKAQEDFEKSHITTDEYDDIINNMPKAGDSKKAHYHVIIMFDGNKSPKQIKAMFAEIDGVGCEKVSDLRAMSRYLCHLDEGGLKPLYSVDDIRQGGGADYRSTARSDCERVVNLQEILLFIKSHELVSYDDLLDLLIDSGMTDYLDLVTKTYHHVIVAYMSAKSKKYWAREEARRQMTWEQRKDEHEALMLQILDALHRKGR